MNKNEIITEYFSRPNNLKLIQFFLNNPNLEATQRDLCKAFGRNYNSNAYRDNLQDLCSLNILNKKYLEQSDNQYSTRAYSLNKDSNISKVLNSLQSELVAAARNRTG